MEYEFEVDYSTKKENLKIIYTHEEYKYLTQQKIYSEKYFDSIDKDYGIFRHHYFIEHDMVADMYSFFCDVISVNYSELCAELIDELDQKPDLTYQQIKNILLKYSVILASHENIYKLYRTQQKNKEFHFDGCFSIDEIIDIKGFMSTKFMPQILLLMYVDGMQKYDELYSPDVFRLFAHDALGVNIKSQRENTCEKIDYYSFSNYIDLSEAEKVDDISEMFGTFISKYKLEDEKTWVYCDSAEEYLCSILYQLLDNGYIIKRCNNCGKYFVPLNRSDTFYCNRISPEDKNKTCREYSTYNNYLSKTRNNEAIKLYKQIYNSKRNKMKRCENENLKQELNQFMQDASKWRDSIKKGNATEAEYIQWLNAMKSNRR